MIQTVGFLNAFSLGEPTAVSQGLFSAFAVAPLPTLLQDVQLLEDSAAEHFQDLFHSFDEHLKDPNVTPKQMRYSLRRLAPAFESLSPQEQESVVHAAAAAQLKLGAFHFAAAKNDEGLLGDFDETAQVRHELGSKILEDWWKPEALEKKRLVDIYHPQSLWRQPLAFWHGARGQWLSHMADHGNNEDLIRGAKHYHLSANHYARMGADRSAIDKFHMALFAYESFGPLDCYIQYANDAVACSLAGGHFVYAAKFSWMAAEGLVENGKNKTEMKTARQFYLDAIAFLERARQAGNGHVLGRTIRMFWETAIRMEMNEKEAGCMQAAHDYSMARDFEQIGVWDGAILAYLEAGMWFYKTDESIFSGIAFRHADIIKRKISMDDATFQELKREAAEEAGVEEFMAETVN